MLRDWLKFVYDPKNKIKRISNVDDLVSLMDKNNRISNNTEQQIGSILHLEGATGIDTELNRLYIYYDCGLRSMSVTWNEQNQFATGAGRDNDKNRGFTAEGLDLLDVMENLGIIIDVSHLNDMSFWDVVNNTNSPIIASHSNLRKWAEHPRNLTDEMVQTIANTGGSIGINFCKGFLSTKENHSANHRCIIEMINHVIELSNISSVHIGSDFDGCTIPDDMKDITSITTIFDELESEFAIDQKDIDKIKRENIMRVMKKVWK